MILDNHDDEPDDEEDEVLVDDEDVDLDGELGEWLGGLRAAGLPIRADATDRPTRPAQQPALALPVEAVAGLVAESLAPATIAAYERDWQHFGGACHAYGIDPIDADPMMVASWIAELAARGLTVATLHRRLAAITYAFGLLGRAAPADDPLVRKTMAGARRRLGTAPRRAIPLGLDDLRRIVTAIPIAG